MLIKGKESHPGAVFKSIADKFDTTWDGNELKSNHPALGQVHVLSYKYFDNCFINVINAKLKEPLTFINQEEDSDRLVFRVLSSGISSSYGQKSNLSRNEILVYNSQFNSKLTFPKDIQLQWLSISVSIDWFEKLVANEYDYVLTPFINDSNWFNYFPLTEDIYEPIQTMYSIRNNKELRRPIFLSRSLEILAVLGTKFKANTQTQNTLTNAEMIQMLEIKDRILSDYQNFTSLKDLSFEYGMSESILQKKFQSTFNLPVKQFFNRHRLEESKRLLKYSDNNISEISYALGFTHIHHFSNTFKKYYGISPNQYRKSVFHNAISFT